MAAGGAVAVTGTAVIPSDVEYEFVDALPDDLQCGICLHAARDACVTEECGHLFCRLCIHGALERREECPVDRKPLTVKGVRKDVRSARRINALVVFCPFRRNGCAWRGCLSDLERHSDRCEGAAVRCPFAPHGCDTITNRKALNEHVGSAFQFHLLLLCGALSRAQDDVTALQQELAIRVRDSERFVWVIPQFESKRGPVYSRKFLAKGLMWYLGVDFDGPDNHAGVYLFAEGHARRCHFRLILFNIDPEKDKVHQVADWSPEFKGKGWGPLKFINRVDLESSGFVVSDAVRLGAELESAPFE